MTTFYKKSLEFYETKQVSLTSFYGGAKRGRCAQLMLRRRNAGEPVEMHTFALSKKDAQGLRNALNQWLDGDQLSEVN